MIFNENYMLWLTTIATDGHAHDCIYKKLFTQLMSTPFRWSSGIPLDMTSDEDIPASVFEVMVALAMRIEADIMHDTEYGDRTSLWFGHMIASLGLAECNDANYDEAYVSSVLERFMDRCYEPC